MTDPKPEEREELARIIDLEAVDWKEPWRVRTGFYANNTGPHRQAAIERDEDNERAEMYVRRAVAFRRADAILSAGYRRETGWRPTHRHLKSGGFYQVIERAKDITNEHGDAGVEVVIYKGVGRHTWVRRAAEFDDGRFVALPAPPTPEAE